MQLCMVSSGMDDFCSSMSGNRIVKPILYHCVKIFCCRSQTIVVDAAFGIDIGNLLPDTTLARTNRTYPLQEFTKIVTPENIIALLQAVIVENKTLPDKFIKNLCRPLAKKCSTLAINTIPNTNNSIKIVKSSFSFYLTPPLSLNCSNFSNS